MLYLTCSTIPSIDLARYGVSPANNLGIATITFSKFDMLFYAALIRKNINTTEGKENRFSTTCHKLNVYFLRISWTKQKQNTWKWKTKYDKVSVS